MKRVKILVGLSTLVASVASLCVVALPTISHASRDLVFSSSSVESLKRTQVDMGFSHGCSLRSNGTIDCWGQNSEKQIGNYDTFSFREPIMQSSLSGITKVSVGLGYTCALNVDQTVKCWGSNSSGQLGTGTNTSTAIPTLVVGLSGVIDLDAGYSRACAVTDIGRVRCWGKDAINVGPGNLFQNSNVSHEVVGVSGAVKVAVGEDFTCVLLTDKAVKCWGSDSGVMGVADATPTGVVGLGDIAAISAGMDHVCAITTSGQAKCWGEGTSGQLGNGSTSSSSAVVNVSGLVDAVDISAGTSQTCAVRVDGATVCWGGGGLGALGNGRSEDSAVPVAVEGISTAKLVSVGSSSACALDSTGLMKCWGDYDKWATQQKTPIRVRLGQSLEVPTVANMRIGDGPQTFNAVASSGLPVTINVLMTGTDALTRNCEVIDGKVYALKAGTCSFSVSQAGDDQFAPIAHTTTSLSFTRTFTIDAWSQPRTNVLTTLVLTTTDGQPLSGKAVSWQTTGGGDSASGGPKTTNADGKVSFGAVSGPALLTVEPQIAASPNPDYGPGPQFLKKFSTVVVFGDGEVRVDIGLKPEVDERVVQVVLPDGTPVRGAVVYNFAKDNGKRLYRYPMASERRIGQATWRSVQATTDGGLGNCQYGNTHGDSDLRAVTDRDGSAVLRGWMTTDSTAKIGVCFNDGELKQEKTAELSEVGTTTVKLSYAAKVVVETTEAKVDSSGQATIVASLVDEVGDPLANKTVTAVQETTSGVTAMASRVGGALAGKCVASSEGKSAGDGKVTLRICPKTSGFWYLKASGMIPSKSFYVRTESSLGGETFTGGTAAGNKTLILRPRQTTTGVQVARMGGLSIPRGAVVTISVSRASSRVCRISGKRLVAIRSGTCKVSVTVRPRVGKRITRVVSVVIK